VRERRSIVTLAIGRQYEQMAKVTHPRMREYAREIGADFHVIRKKLGPSMRPPHFEKLQARYLLDVYDRVLFLDTDIAIAAGAPDIFAEVPSGEFAGYDELGRLGQRWDVIMTFWEWLLFRAGCPGPASRYYLPRGVAYLNAGVWLFDRSHRSLFRDPPRSCWEFQLPEQTFLNFLIRCDRVKVFRLSPRWNYMTHYLGNDLPARFPVYFYHVIGYGSKDRLGTLRRLIHGTKNS